MSASTATVLVSGFGDDGRGGMFRVDGHDVEQIDTMPTTGVAVGNGRVARLLRAPSEVTSATELVVYDERGLLEYARLDTIRDPHDVLPHRDGWLVVSTGTNEIVYVHPAGRETVWQDSDVPDASHINCITVADGDLWASAFGRFTRFKEWRGERARGAGVLWNIRTGAELGGLSHPHTPRYHDGRWLVCESILGTLVARTRDGHVVASCDLGGYTRGIAIADSTVLVGVSAKRDTKADAFLAIVDLDSFTCVDRVVLPCSEIYDIVEVPDELVHGMRVGVATNASRAATPGAGLAGHAGLAAQDVDPATCACAVSVELPASLHAGEARLLDVTIDNRGAAPLASVLPYAVFVASRWTAPGREQIDGDRMPLPVVLQPGARTSVALPVVAPSPGTYRLSVSLVREGRFWFDDLDPHHGAHADVEVQ